MIEHIKHLRGINFKLTALSVGVLILALAAKEPWAQKGFNEVSDIKSFIQSQKTSSYGKFGTLWIKRRLQKEYGVYEIERKQGKVVSDAGTELDCFAFHNLSFPGCLLDSTTLNTPNARLIEDVLSNMDSIDTISKWKDLWDGIYASKGNLYWVEKVLYDESEILIVNHRPEYQRSAFGTIGFGSLLNVVVGAKPKPNLTWTWGSCEERATIINHNRFVFLRPSAGHLAESYSHSYWTLLFDNPDDTKRPRFDLKDWNNDAFYFLHIPVQTKKINIDLQTIITNDANADWQTGPFKLSFPGLHQTFGNDIDIPFDEAEIVLSKLNGLEKRLVRSLRIWGVEIIGVPFFFCTLLILFVCQIYFLIHLAYYLIHIEYLNKKKEQNNSTEYPWIALYDSSFARSVFLISCIVPAVASILVFSKFGGGDILSVMIVNILISSLIVIVYLKRPSRIYMAMKNVFYGKNLK